jgi:NAD(P)-dependent dehydrogenase (short-subunit alcohol dehydrogenase family)
MGALGAQADLLRVPLADGTLVATPDLPSDELVPGLLAASDVLGTGWFGAVAAQAGPGKCLNYEVPLMLKQGGGAIVNTSSGAGVKGFGAGVAYHGCAAAGGARCRFGRPLRESTPRWATLVAGVLPSSVASRQCLRRSAWTSMTPSCALTTSIFAPPTGSAPVTR